MNACCVSLCAYHVASFPVERLQRRVRDHRAGYAQSLGVLRRVRQAFPDVVTKTSLMLGVGETPDEIRATMRDCRDAGVQVGRIHGMAELCE